MNIIEPKWNWNSGLSKRSSTKYIALHHAEASSCSVYDVDAWHKQNGWSGIGYHFFVRKNGEIYRGRPLDSLGAHVQGMNDCSLGICAEGSYMKETMPQVQKKAIAELIDYLKTKFYPNAQIVGHREIGSSDCPGTNFPLDELKNYKSLLGGTTNSGTSASGTSASGTAATTTTDSNSENKEARLISTGVGKVKVKDSFKNAAGDYHHALLVDGTDITKYVGNLSWSNSTDELSTSMSFEVAKTDMKYMNMKTPKAGGIVSLFTNTEIFRGIIVKVDDGGTYSNTYSAFDFGWYLNKSKETYQFNNTPAIDAIAKICRDFNVDICSVPNLNIRITQIYIDKTISEIIDDILERCDKVYTYDVIPAGLRIYELGSIYAYPEFRISPNTRLLYSPSYLGSQSHDISIEEMRNSVKVVTEKDSLYTVKKVLRDTDSIYEYGLLQEVVTVDPDKYNVDIIAKNNFENLNKATETYSIDIIEQVESYTMAGYRITVGGENYLITGANHSIKDGIHYVSLTLKRYTKDLLTKQESGELPENTSSGTSSGTSSKTSTSTSTSTDNNSNAWVTKWNATCYGWVGDDNGVCGWKSIRFRAQNSNTMLITGCHVAIPTYCVQQASCYNDAWAKEDFPELAGGYGTVLEIRSPETGKTCRAVVADCGNFGPHNKYNHSTALDLAPNTLNALGLSKSTHKIEYRVVGKVSDWDGSPV